jgi:hypothetical protein
MRTNIGNWERLIRIWLGAVLIGLAATDIIGLWGWIGVVPVITGFIGWCPLYAIFGFSTCPAKG